MFGRNSSGRFLSGQALKRDKKQTSKQNNQFKETNTTKNAKAALSFQETLTVVIQLIHFYFICQLSTN